MEAVARVGVFGCSQTLVDTAQHLHLFYTLVDQLFLYVASRVGGLCVID